MPFATTAALIGAGIGGSVAGGLINKSAADNQAKAGLKATDESVQLQRDIFNQTQKNEQPWLNAGGQAVTSLADMLKPGGSLTKDFTTADFQTDPGYEFRLAEGQKALERSAAAKGNLFSGSTLKALDQYNQNFASNEFQNAYNRFQQNRSTKFNQLASVAGLGQTASGTLAAAGSNYGANAGNTLFSGLTGAANASAAGQVALGQGIQQGINSGLNWYQLTQMNKQPTAPTFPTFDPQWVGH